jgi:CBS-domain-containing membrane protein
MPVVRDSTRGILKGLLVEEAMRRQVIGLPHDASLDRCVNQLIKFKVNALLVSDDKLCPVGVVSKTDIVGAFYGGLAIKDSRLMDIMNGPPLICFPDDELGVALDLMRRNGVHQLFVQGAESCAVIGTLSYSDVVALLYRYCRACPKGAVRRPEHPDRADLTQFLIVRDAMKAPVISCRQEDSLAGVIEELMAHRLGAVLIQDVQGLPVGVVSKTDVIVAYNHGSGLEVEARSIMKAPVASCDERSFLSDAIRHMFLKDVQRLFAYAGDQSHIVGVLSLSDAAQVRSGSCRACETSRIIAAP